MTDLRVSSAAEDDYAAALKWYAERSVETAERFDAELNQTLKRLPPLQNDFHNAIADTASF